MAHDRAAGPEYMPEEMSDEHGELLARNIFVVTMLGSLVFVLGSLYSVLH